MKILDLYNELLKQIKKESKDLQNKDKLTDRLIVQNQDKKKILMDKIDKEQAKGLKIGAKDKEIIRNIILEISDLENKNRENYKKEMESIKNKIKSTKVEKNLRNSYTIKANIKSKIDKKK
jgi:hypothetical protein